MLKQWTVENFKSFFGKTTLDLAPITILAGANSSGKSSLIQSILLIKQTLQYAPSQRPIGLNGPLLKLGRFDDIKNSEAESKSIGIGWVIDELSSYNSMELSAFRYYLTSSNEAPQTVEFSMQLGVSEGGLVGVDELDTSRLAKTAELTQLQPILLAVSSKVAFGDTESKDISEIHLSGEAAKSAGSQGQIGSVESLLKFRVKDIDVNTFNSITGNRPNSELVAAGVTHFLPDQVGFSFDQRLYFALKVAEYLVNPSSHLRYVDSAISNFDLPYDVIVYIISGAIQIAKDNEQPHLFHRGEDFLGMVKDRSSLTAREFVENFETASRALGKSRQLLRTWLLENQEAIQLLILENNQNLSARGVETGRSRSLSASAEQIRTFFQSNIHYLGPLRDEPRPIYPLEALINPKDVGYRGEHTAAVFDLHRDTTVQCFKSSDANKLIGASREFLPLHVAVQDWLSYLGVAEGVSTADLGKMGHQLQVTVDVGSAAHDLTNVGVGVSQLLPIVVMSLLAEAPCLLILEQPELHLHPKVQARLADFFFSLSLLGKQCFLETHSEYLVERFRLRIAEAPDESLNSQVKIYFTKKSKGRTVCDEVRISRYGAVIDWPDDFFDQSQSETERILRAAQNKRSNEKNLGWRQGPKT